MAYEQTSIDPMKSWGEITSILYAHGCKGSAYAEKPGEGFQIEFIKDVKGKSILVRIPVGYDFTPAKDHYGRNKPVTEAQKQQEIRTKWRSLFYYIKAQFDAIDKGIVVYEQAFFADIVGYLPDGRQGRAIEVFLPEVMDGRLSSVKLLPDPPKDDPEVKSVTVELIQ